MVALYPRNILDITTTDLILAASGALNGTDTICESHSLEQDIGSDTLVTLSVRSAWDLMLTAMDLPTGSEVIMSAVTIPDMKRIAEAHGLVIIPVDLDPHTMAPEIDAFTNAFSHQTRLVMIAHLLGGSFDVTPYADIADAHRVPIIEDRAQAFVGPHDWGSRRTLASLYSFGSIKTSTALGSAIAIVRDSALLAAMRNLQSQWEVQPATVFVRKAAKYLGVQGFRSPYVYGAVANVASRYDDGLDGFIRRTVKGFQADSIDALLALLRRRPSGAQVRLLRKRLDSFDAARLAARRERGELLSRQLSLVCDMLGTEQSVRTHWLLAAVVPKPASLIARLRATGFDATQGATTITALNAPSDRMDCEPKRISTVMSNAVFLPAYPEMPAKDAAKMVNAIFAVMMVSAFRARSGQRFGARSMAREYKRSQIPVLVNPPL